MRILLPWLIAILTAMSIHAGEKVPIQLPLGLSPGISRDSTLTILLSGGASPVSEREGMYAFEFSYAGIPMRTVVPVFLKSSLHSVVIYSDPVENKEDHISRINKAFDIIKETFDCQVIEDRITDGKMPEDLNNGVELASFSSKDFSLFIDSEYKAGEGYKFSIHVHSQPMTISPSLK